MIKDVHKNRVYKGREERGMERMRRRGENLKGGGKAVEEQLEGENRWTEKSREDAERTKWFWVPLNPY